MITQSRIFNKLAQEFLAALKACRARASGEAVHRLRTSAGRLEALLFVQQQRGSGGEELARLIECAKDALRVVRRASGPVRDLEVQRLLLRRLDDDLQQVYAGAKGRLKARQTRELDMALRENRRGALREFKSVLRRSGDEAAAAVAAVEGGLDGELWRSELKFVLRWIEESGARLREGSSKSLHAYRRRMKVARCVAEMEQGSRAAERVAKRVKEVVDALGSWHDWALLRGSARERLGASAPLVRALTKERRRSRRRAMDLTERLRKL